MDWKHFSSGLLTFLTIYKNKLKFKAIAIKKREKYQMRKILATSAVLFCFIASPEQSNAISASERMNDLGDKIAGFLRRAPKASSTKQEQDISHINPSSRSSVDLEPI